MSRGGYSVFRLWVREHENPLEVVKELLALGVLVEREDRLIAVAVPPQKDLGQVVSYILTGKDSERWGAQDGFVVESGG